MPVRPTVGAGNQDKRVPSPGGWHAGGGLSGRRGGMTYAANGSRTSFQVGELTAMSMSRAKMGKPS